MRRVLVLAEGQCEERFIKDTLQPHLWNFNVSLVPTIIKTRKDSDGTQYKGGVIPFRKFEQEVRLLLQDSGAQAVTTMIDYYALPSDFPGMDSRPSGNCYDRVQHVERSMSDYFNGDTSRQFYPFLTLHELEALLFSDIDVLAALSSDVRIRQALGVVARATSMPEEINETPDGAPSKRILKAWPEYRKLLYGPTCLQQIGIRTLVSRCPHFGSWVQYLESLESN